MMEQESQVVVIGAGISGLSAAKLLHDEGIDVVVLEARDRVGGRTYTIKDDKVGHVDLGGAYIGPTQNRILRHVKDLGLTTYKVYDELDLVQYSKGSANRFQGTFPSSWNPLITLDINNLMRLMDQYGSQIPLDAPWKAPKAKEWDNMTMKDFLDQTLWTSAARRFADGFVQVNVTSEPHEVSMLWFLWYVAQCGGTMRIFSVANGGQERKVVGGTQQISKGLANKLQGRVYLNEPATFIQQTETGVTISNPSGNRAYKCKHAILAMAPPLLSKLVYEPPLPQSRIQLCQRYPMGCVIKVTIFYKTAFWRQKGLQGMVMIEDEGLPIGLGLDDCKDGCTPALMGFILADRARHFAKMSKEERCQRVAECYAKALGSTEALYPVHYEDKNWSEEQWSGGCYTACMPPGVMTNFGSILREPVGRLFFAGTECATHWSGYMEGAVQAGEMAARQILYEMSKISKDEIAVEEPESQEVRAKPFKLSFWERYSPSVPGFLTMAVTLILMHQH